MTQREIAFEMATSSIRFGAGVTREVGMDLTDLGARNALVLSDPFVSRMRPVQTVLESLETNRIAHRLYDRVRVALSKRTNWTHDALAAPRSLQTR